MPRSAGVSGSIRKRERTSPPPERPLCSTRNEPNHDFGEGVVLRAASAASAAYLPIVCPQCKSTATTYTTETHRDPPYNKCKCGECEYRWKFL